MAILFGLFEISPQIDVLYFSLWVFLAIFSIYKFVTKGITRYSISLDGIEVFNFITRWSRKIEFSEITEIDCYSRGSASRFPFLFYRMKIKTSKGVPKLDFPDEEMLAAFIKELPEMTKGIVFIESKEEMDTDFMRALPQKD